MESELCLLGGNKCCNRQFGKWPAFKEEYVSGFKSVLMSGFWGGIHANSELSKFEEEFASYMDVKYSLGVTNGTVALIMALKALEIEEGAEVIIPSMSFIATATAVSIAGMIPVFVDIEDSTHCISLESVKKNLTEKTKAIIPVHIAGYPCDMQQIVSFAKEHDLYVIEDCCQAHGAKLNGKRVGSYGDIGVFSFAGTKCMTAGEGGALTTSSRILYEKMCSMRNHGRVSSMDYYHERLGCNYRMNEFQANMLRIQLKDLDRQIEQKRKNVTYLLTKLEELHLDWLEFLDYKNEAIVHGFYSFGFLYRKEKFGDVPKKLICEVIQSEGIPVGDASVTSRPIYDNPIYTDKENSDYCLNRKSECVNTVRGYEQLIVIGQSVHTAILLGSFEDMDSIVSVIDKINKNKQTLIDYYNQLEENKKIGGRDE